MSSWIDLVSYATKYGVSQSTLRRRIRTKAIPFKLEKGKYFLEDSPTTIEKAPLFSRQSEITQNKIKQRADSGQGATSADLEELRAENRQLKGQIAELETLLKALEAELEITQ